MLADSGARRYNVERMAATRITWRDALLMPEDGKRYEAIDGNLYVTAAPSYRHQRITLKLGFALYRLLDLQGHGQLAYGPVGIEFPETDEGVQPDIVFVSKDRLRIVEDDQIRGAPDLVVEILSPTTAKRDRTIKLKLYERQGVAQYWVVDPDAECVEVWDFAAKATAPSRHVRSVPVSLEGERIGDIALPPIFRP